jgi:hypothetical protein
MRLCRTFYGLVMSQSGSSGNFSRISPRTCLGKAPRIRKAGKQEPGLKPVVEQQKGQPAEIFCASDVSNSLFGALIYVYDTCKILVWEVC